MKPSEAKIKSRSKRGTQNTITIGTTDTAYKNIIPTSGSVFTNVSTTRRIENATEGLTFECFNNLNNKLLPQNEANAITICEYIHSMRSEINPASQYRKDVIVLLCKFSSFFRNAKAFREITREDILAFLDSFRKPEIVDPLHKWIGTYNIYRMHLMRFFKWLYYPDLEYAKRPKPQLIENIPNLKRKEKSIYKPTDLWTQEDDTIFLRYCPNSRDKCYHSMARDSAARPHDLLKLRIKELVFKLTPDKKQYAEVLLNGKTGSRSIPLIGSIPYIKDWINNHPQSGNLTAVSQTNQIANSVLSAEWF